MQQVIETFHVTFKLEKLSTISQIAIAVENCALLFVFMFELLMFIEMFMFMFLHQQRERRREETISV